MPLATINAFIGKGYGTPIYCEKPIAKVRKDMQDESRKRPKKASRKKHNKELRYGHCTVCQTVK